MKKILLSVFLAILVMACQHAQKKSTTTEKPVQQTEQTPKNRNLKPNGEPFSDEELANMSHDEAMAILREAPKDTINKIGYLLYDGFFTLDAMGPLSVLNSIYPAEKYLIGRHKGIIKSNDGVSFSVDYSIEDIDQLDILVVPGGFIQTYQATKDEELLEWIRKIDQNSKYTMSVCTGAWILGSAGLLEGREATTNWYRAEEKLALYNAKYVRKRYTNDGKYWTSAGVSAGIDMSLALVDEIMGRNYAEFIALNIEYDPEPPFEGGHPDKADRLVTAMLVKMFDEGLEPYLENE